MRRSFLQTRDWLEFQGSLGRKTWRIDGLKIQANIIRHDLPFGKNYLYVPHGPSFNLAYVQSGISNELKSFTDYLKNIGQENKSIFIKMEPLYDVVPELFFKEKIKIRKSKKQIQPQKTVVVDLRIPEEDILDQMRQKTRYNIRLSEKKDLELVESRDIEIFGQLLKKTAEKDRFRHHPLSYYKNLLDFFQSDQRDLETKLYLVRARKNYIAGVIVLFYGDTAYYLHGAMDRDYRELMAPYFLHWGIIQIAKRREYDYYDLWGIDAQKWPGVTRFKIGFGGRVVEHPGSFDLSLRWAWHLAYRVVQKLRQ